MAKAKKKTKSETGTVLVVVESPTKAKTLTKMLGPGYTVKASVGHIMDLPKSRLAIDVDSNFQPEYILVKGKAKIKKELVSLASKSRKVLLASDPDREGEAIAWHLAGLMDIEPDSECRIRVHQITKDAVVQALDDPEPIDMAKVNAQQARRVLDRLVGYTLSPLLWKKIRYGLSAGRVQSVALTILCRREKEIETFEPQPYWIVEVDGSSEDGRRYHLKVEKKDGKTLMVKGRPMKIDSAEKAQEIVETVKREGITVTSFTTREGRRKAPAPLKTSTLQQEAARRLGFSPRRAMRVAQSLFEGINIHGRGLTGLITYMRTDSLRLAPEAIGSIRDLISKGWGKNYLPEKANVFSSKGRSQDAHEAIRPTDISLKPEDIKSELTPEQYRLYDLIWRRTVACQMTPAKIDNSTVEAASGPYGLRQKGAVVRFEGWGAVWPIETKDDIVSPAVEGETLSVDGVDQERKETKPPARFTEASLIKTLEDEGVGRPSTYASIVETLYDRAYVEKDDEKHLVPTALGRSVDDFLLDHFDGDSVSPIVNTGFTATMEESLDLVEENERDWVDVVSQFWEPFTRAIAEAEKAPKVPPPPPEFIGEDCPECGKPLVKKRGRFGEFIACSGYPECKYTRPILKKIGVPCPKCGSEKGGEVVQRKSKKGRNFYGCSRYPDCDFVSWNKPAVERCPECGGLMEYKGRSRTPVCTQCGHKGVE
ncbi:DNA topoisomerase I [Dethiosulfovibrio peptidovorans DSM 11002]|uniref:DNA topoisomerase 1 n=1 Tax=Dethiosulfovibrio peptidovorans DSM 11002 TaxID=469381 RepID=D2Z3N4_9BACT|nr:type I DNA topoisomerase [Dethiosulfovibrio peptidovorans]EFC90340.1 DNA topoisomerase I [Dethiosulfovibrio peptidovorans DSM 11002]